MKFAQSLAAAVVALSAVATASHHHAHRHLHDLARRGNDSCPAGYTMSTYLSTIYITPTPTPTPTTTSTPEPTTTSTVTVHETSTTTLVAEKIVSSSSTSSSSSTTSTSTTAPAAPSPPPVAAAAAAAPSPVTTSAAPPVIQKAVAVTSSSSTSSPPAAPAASSPSSAGSAGGAALGAANTGERATFYTGTVAGGTCSFTQYTLPASIFGTALSQASWDTASNCGACAKVTYGGKSIVAMITDECPECPSNGFDLFESAFSELAPTSTGVLAIDWELVHCGLDSPLELVNQDGSSANWFSIQVQNHNLPIQSLEVSTDGGNTWKPTTRAYYNFFQEASGFGSNSVDVRVTSTTGKSIVVNNVQVASTASTTASANF